MPHAFAVAFYTIAPRTLIGAALGFYTARSVVRYAGRMRPQGAGRLLIAAEQATAILFTLACSLAGGAAGARTIHRHAAFCAAQQELPHSECAPLLPPPLHRRTHCPSSCSRQSVTSARLLFEPATRCCVPMLRLPTWLFVPSGSRLQAIELMKNGVRHVVT